MLKEDADLKKIYKSKMPYPRNWRDKFLQGLRYKRGTKVKSWLSK